MKRRLIIAILAFVMILPISGFTADSEEILKLKINALQWEFNARRSDVSLLQGRMREIKEAVAGLQREMEDLKAKEKAKIEAEKAKKIAAKEEVIKGEE